MQKFLNDLIPNVMAKLPDFYAAIGDTLLMVVWAGAISFRSRRAAYGHKSGWHSGKQDRLSYFGQAGQPVPVHSLHHPADMGHSGIPCHYPVPFRLSPSEYRNEFQIHR